MSVGERGDLGRRAVAHGVQTLEGAGEVAITIAVTAWSVV